MTKGLKRYQFGGDLHFVTSVVLVVGPIWRLPGMFTL